MNSNPPIDLKVSVEPFLNAFRVVFYLPRASWILALSFVRSRIIQPWAMPWWRLAALFYFRYVNGVYRKVTSISPPSIIRFPYFLFHPLVGPCTLGSIYRQLIPYLVWASNDILSIYAYIVFCLYFTETTLDLRLRSIIYFVSSTRLCPLLGSQDLGLGMTWTSWR